MPNWSEEGFQRILDAANRGRIKQQEKLKKLQEEYYKNPKKCLNCNEAVEYKKKRENKFCSKKCADTFNAVKRIKNKTCLVCENQIKKGASKYCSFKCQQTYLFNQRVENWIKGEYETKTRDFFKRYLTENQGYKCSCCSIIEWNNKAIVLEIDHIDGNSENNRPENLRFICPNCHSQTDTYKGKNVGNGRHYRRERYAAGQSY
jgi:predicted nucleic acid-binding Zn ribbon protein|tara:strand:+ start:345 stop:956 length:612 start_codon:yes stop_codon:yes gene_type:complete